MFTTYDYVHALQQKWAKQNNANWLCEVRHGGASIFTSGAIAGISQSLLSHPAEMIVNTLERNYALSSSTTKLSTTISPMYSGHFISCGADLLRQDGARGLFRNLHISMFRDAIGSGMFFWTFSQLKHAAHSYERSHPSIHSSWFNVFTIVGAGMISGSIYHTIAHPFNVIQAYLLTQQYEHELKQLQRPIVERVKYIHPSYMNAASSFLRQSGIGSIYSTLFPRLIHIFSPSVMGLIVYEFVREYHTPNRSHTHRNNATRTVI
jgi:hypothetical protein